MAVPVPEKRGIFDTIFSFRKKKDDVQGEVSAWGPVNLTPEGMRKEKIRLLNNLTNLSLQYDKAAFDYINLSKKMAGQIALLSGEAKVNPPPPLQPPLGVGPAKLPTPNYNPYAVQTGQTYPTQPIQTAQNYPYVQNYQNLNTNALNQMTPNYYTGIQNPTTLLTAANAANAATAANLTAANTANTANTANLNAANYQYTRNVGGRHKNKSRRRRRYGYSRRSSRT